MISYCVAVYRPAYARLLLDDLVRKTSAPCEVLLWLNVADPALERFIEERRRAGLPFHVVGRTPHNIGMRAYLELFRVARHPLIAQIDDDVVCVSPGIAQTAGRLFERFPRVRQLVADVWQDEFTTGARPPMSSYRCYDAAEGLYEGPIDGWFSVYHRSIRGLLLSLPYSEYCFVGGLVQGLLGRQGRAGLLCTRMKVFHVIGPEYASLFGMLDFEVEKYRRLRRDDIVDWYQGARESLPAAEVLRGRFEAAVRTLESGSS